jgi:putative holliday junction resolvase
MTDYSRTFLGVDFGTRRIGIAKSDPTGLIASALETLEVRSMKDAVEKTVALLKEYEPVGLVVGYPLLASGDRSAKCDEIDNFIAKVTRVFPIDVYKVDERYTSQEAAGVIHAHGQRTGKDKKRIDRIAAVIILQRFLDESGADRRTD